MDRRDPLILAALAGLCSNPKIVGVMPPAKIGALAVSVAKAVDAKLDPEAERADAPPGAAAPPLRSVASAAPPVAEGPKRGDVQLHAPRHPHD